MKRGLLIAILLLTIAPLTAFTQNSESDSIASDTTTYRFTAYEVRQAYKLIARGDSAAQRVSRLEELLSIEEGLTRDQRREARRLSNKLRMVAIRRFAQGAACGAMVGVFGWEVIIK